MLVGLLLAAIVAIVLATSVLRLHPILALLGVAFVFGLLAGVEPGQIVAVLTSGFGATIGSVGPIILLGSVIGIVWERSGAAMRIAKAVLDRSGPRGLPAAMGGIGFVTAVPVFCDTGLIVLSPLNRALSARAGVPLAVGGLALAFGLYAAHVMVPPTPGPVAAAAILNADLGLVLAVGLPVGLITAAAGLIFVLSIRHRMPTLELAAGAEPADEAKFDRPLIIAMLPLVLPLALILAGSVAAMPNSPVGGALAAGATFFGQPLIALSLGVLCAFFLPKRFERRMLSNEGWVGDAFRDSAMVILITGAGGAFGKVLQATDIGQDLGQLVSAAGLGVLAPLLIAAAIKSAQGSSTVAIVTTASLVAPLLGDLGLEGPMGAALVTVAIGAGAMAVSHVNDSFFWVVTQLLGLSVPDGLRFYSVGTAIQAFTAALVLLGLQSLII
ncbi:MAG: GntP family permease [Pseudomonadota bacterium]